MLHQLNKWCNHLTSIRYMGTVPQRKICAVLGNYAAYSGNSFPDVSGQHIGPIFKSLLGFLDTSKWDR